MTTRLSPLDLAFLGLETQRTPVNVASLQLFELPKDYPGNFVRDLIERLMQLQPGPPFNLKLSSGMPYISPSWVVDPHFDLGYHVRHSAVPKPGSMQDLLSVVSRLHSRVMDRDRPLWEFHVIEGLQENRFAIYMKMHHAAIDGMGGMAILEACLHESPDTPLRAPWQGVPGDESSHRSAIRSVEGLVRQARQQARMGLDLGRLLLGNGAKLLGMQPSHSPVPFTAPRSLFNVRISQARRFVARTLSLSEIKALGKAHGASVNDVVLAICSGALRRYLAEKNALPEETLVATVPVSIRHMNRLGSQITYVGAKLGTQHRDPLKRLEEIHQSTEQGKAEVADVTPGAAITFAVMAQGLLALLNRIRLTDLLPPPANVVISNVPGPRKPLYFGGAHMLANYPLSMLVDGQALNITVVSYCDSVDFGLMADRDALPDVALIGDYIEDSMAELGKAVARAKRRDEKRAARARAGATTAKSAAKSGAKTQSPPEAGSATRTSKKKTATRAPRVAG